MIITDTPTGVKASMQHFLATIPTARMEKAPGQRRRLYLLAWLHAVVMERPRYAPIGWSGRYELSETVAACTLGQRNPPPSYPAHAHARRPPDERSHCTNTTPRAPLRTHAIRTLPSRCSTTGSSIAGTREADPAQIPWAALQVMLTSRLTERGLTTHLTKGS